MSEPSACAYMYIQFMVTERERDLDRGVSKWQMCISLPFSFLFGKDNCFHVNALYNMYVNIHVHAFLITVIHICLCSLSPSLSLSFLFGKGEKALSLSKQTIHDNSNTHLPLGLFPTPPPSSLRFLSGKNFFVPCI